MTARNTRKGGANTLTRRRSNRQGRANLSASAKVNDRVEIWWSVDKTFYRGTLTRRHEGTTFRIVYDDGELEDLDLNDEYWRHAIDPSPQGATILNDDDADVTEVVLDGSGSPPQTSKSAKQKSSNQEKPKPTNAGTPTPMDIDKPSSQQSPAKETHKPSSTSAPAKDVAVISKSGVAVTRPDPNKTTATGKVVGECEAILHKSEATPVTPPSDGNKSAKARPKQKAVRVRKDTTGDRPSKSKPRKGGLHEACSLAKPALASTPTTPGRTSIPSKPGGASTKPHPEPKNDKGKIVGDEAGSWKASKKVDGAILADTRVGLDKACTSAKKATETATKMQMKTVGDSINCKDVETKGVSAPDKASQRAVEASREVRVEKGNVAKDAGMKAASHSGTERPAPKPKGTKIKASKAKCDFATPVDSQSVEGGKPPSARNKVTTTQQPKREVDKHEDLTGDSQKFRRHVSTAASVRHVGAVVGGGRQTSSHPQPKNVSKGLARDITLTTDRGSADAKVTKKEDSNRSRSSVEKPNTSFAADRKKKKRKVSAAANSNKTDRGSSGHPSGIEKQGKRSENTQTQPEPRVTVSLDTASRGKNSQGTGKNCTKVVEQSKSGPNSLPVRLKLNRKDHTEDTENMRPATRTSSGISHDKNGEGVVTDGNLIEADGTQAIARSNSTSGAPTHDVHSVKKVREQDFRPCLSHERAQRSTPARRKRDRAEEVNNINAPKRAKNQATQGGSPVEKANRNARAPEGHSVEDRQHLMALGREVLTPVRNRVEGVSEDVQRLVSLLLGFKQELEFYKDVVHRSVVEQGGVVHRSVIGQGGNIQAAIQELRNEMLHAIDERARETEHRLTVRFQSMLANYQGIGGINRPVPINLRNGHVPHEPPRTSRNFDGRAIPHVFTDVGGSNYPSPDQPVVAQVPGSDAHAVLDENVNGHNESPTAIANVNQGSRLEGFERNRGSRDTAKDAEDGMEMGALVARVSHLVARQVTVWLLETPHEYKNDGSVAVWANQTAARSFEEVAAQLKRFDSYMQAYHTLCSSLGNDAVELQWFVSPGVQEHLRRARRNYAAWDPPPRDDEWNAEMALLRELSERFERAVQRYDGNSGTDMEACVAISQIAAADQGVNGYRTANGGN